MPPKKEPLRVLVISKSSQMTDLLIDTLPASQYHPINHVATVGEAKRTLLRNRYDIVVINTPLADDFGVQTALDLASDRLLGILIMVKNDIFDQVTYKVEDSGILTLPKPTTKQTLYSTIKILSATRYKLQAMEHETKNLRSKMDEIKTITRAKWILIDQLHMDEPQAHRHIEKQAMDRCVKKVEIANNIIRTYER